MKIRYWSTIRFEGSERLRGKPMTSSEARTIEAQIGSPIGLLIGSNKARDLELVTSVKREAEKSRLVQQLPQAKREV